MAARAYLRYVLYALLFGTGAASSAFVARVWNRSSSVGQASANSLNVVDPNQAAAPVVDRNAFMNVNGIDAKYVDSYLTVPEGYSLNVSVCLHLLRMFGPEATIQLRDRAPVRVLDAVTSVNRSKPVFGESPIVETAHGVRFPTGPSPLGAEAYETHRDQCLGTFAEIGLSLKTRIYIGDKTFTVMDVLQDSIANFHLEQRELEWTTLAYCGYVAPTRNQWANRFGKSFTFDDLAIELLNRPMGYQSCGGLHCLAALSSMYKADLHFDILSPHIRDKVATKLREFIALSASRQEQDGRWHPGWTIPYADTSGNAFQPLMPYRTQTVAKDEYVLATGHTCEWLLGLRGQIEVPQNAIDKGVLWLSGVVNESSTSDRWSNFCPWSHAVKVVCLAPPPGENVN